MNMDGIDELSLMRVWERGVPNRECIGFTVNETVEMAQFALLVGPVNSFGGVIPQPDQMFWFGNATVNKGDYIFVYTGGGTPALGKSIDGRSSVYTLFWNRPKTIFANPMLVPALVKFCGVQCLNRELDQPQIGGEVLNV